MSGGASSLFDAVSLGGFCFIRYELAWGDHVMAPRHVLLPTPLALASACATRVHDSHHNTSWTTRGPSAVFGESRTTLTVAFASPAGPNTHLRNLC